MVLFTTREELFILFRHGKSRWAEASVQLPGRFCCHMGSWTTIPLTSRAAWGADLDLPAASNSSTPANGVHGIGRPGVGGSNGRTGMRGPGSQSSEPPDRWGNPPRRGSWLPAAQGKASYADSSA